MAFERASSTSVAEIARLLHTRKEQGRHTSLFLGSRVGGLFRNQTFYEYLRGYSLFNFDELSEVGKFQECYHVLQKHIDEEDTRVILTESLKSVAYREEDELLAELIRIGLFDAIISTNIDSLLEDTFVLKGMRRPNDYLVLNGLDSNRGRLHLQEDCCIMIKAFGELGSLNYRVPNSDFKIVAKSSLKKFLRSILLQDILVLGYDPLWDQSLEQLFVTQTGFCYVNEELPPENSKIANTLEKSKGQYLVGINCQRFTRELHNIVIKRPMRLRPRRTAPLITVEPMTDPATILPGSRPKKTAPLTMHDPPAKERRKIFVSYSHKDKAFLERFRTLMEPYLRNEKDLLELWDDTNIEGGQLWDREIKNALLTARVAVLLVSENFFGSDYIVKHEVPLLLTAANNEEVVLVPVIVGGCDFNTSLLSPYQAMNSISLPLAEMTPHDQDRVWIKTAERVYNIVMEDKE